VHAQQPEQAFGERREVVVGPGQDGGDVPVPGDQEAGAVPGQLLGIGGLIVSGSVHGARLAGIEVLAVAGIGGVHRGAAASFDVSADLPAFTQNRVAVFCAGVKSILDAGLTLEWLETHSVPVVGYRCDEFPGYVSVSSGRRNPHRLDDLGLIARAVLAHWDAGFAGGFLVTHPIAAEHGVPFDVLEARIAEAEAAARLFEEQGAAVKADADDAEAAVAEVFAGARGAAR
jgi:pseudouridine-5'-phosphate glycosidase